MGKSEQEWGPWIRHDGLGCPVKTGVVVEVVYEDAFGYRANSITTVTGGGYSSWNWEHFPELKRILRYRERRPKGLQLLDDILAELDEDAPADPVRTDRPLIRSSC